MARGVGREAVVRVARVAPDANHARVLDASVLEQQARADRAHLRIERVQEHGFEPSGRPHLGVVVQQHDDLPGRREDALIDLPREVERPVEVDDPHVRAESANAAHVVASVAASSTATISTSS